MKTLKIDVILEKSFKIEGILEKSLKIENLGNRGHSWKALKLEKHLKMPGECADISAGKLP